MKGKYQRKTKEMKEMARERIEVLFKQAKKAFNKDPKLSNRYMKLARELAMKAKVRIPSSLKKQFCKHCYSYLVPSKNARIRLQKAKLVYFCENCKKYMRFPYKGEKG